MLRLVRLAGHLAHQLPDRVHRGDARLRLSTTPHPTRGWAHRATTTGAPVSDPACWRRTLDRAGSETGAPVAVIRRAPELVPERIGRWGRLFFTVVDEICSPAGRRQAQTKLSFYALRLQFAP